MQSIDDYMENKNKRIHNFSNSINKAKVSLNFLHRYGQLSGFYSVNVSTRGAYGYLGHNKKFRPSKDVPFNIRMPYAKFFHTKYSDSILVQPTPHCLVLSSLRAAIPFLFFPTRAEEHQSWAVLP